MFALLCTPFSPLFYEMWHDMTRDLRMFTWTRPFLQKKVNMYLNDIIFCTFQYFVMPQICWQHLYFQVSSMKCGLLYLSQESCLIGDVSYHNYEGLVVEKAEWESLSRDLGVHNKVMLLRNHGKSWFKRNFNKYVKTALSQIVFSCIQGNFFLISLKMSRS